MRMHDTVCLGTNLEYIMRIQEAAQQYRYSSLRAMRCGYGSINNPSYVPVCVWMTALERPQAGGCRGLETRLCVPDFFCCAFTFS